MPLDPWIIEEIKKREREKEERDRARIELPVEGPGRAPEPERGPEMPSDRKPGYEMPNPNEPSRPPAEKKKEDSDRGVTQIDIGGGSSDEDEDDGTIDITRLPDIPPDDAFEERSE